ncbi:hypothetical protein [Brevundimonas sp. GCM10030266]|uniref:hypothetical protein n=1 Tax=Brevundimonas sp. GCM10030266 TaxID=3273386 RepID=UPI00361F325F
MTEAEEEMLAALAWMAAQYLNVGDNWLDHMCMSAGEMAVEVLVARGLVEPEGRGGRWTQAGLDFLAKH